MQGCHLVESHKSAGCGPVRSPETVPAREQENKKANQKQHSKNRKNTQPKTKPNKNDKEKWDRNPCYPCETAGTARADWRWGVRGCRCYRLRYLRGGGPGWVTTSCWFNHLRDSGWLCFAIRIPVISRVKAAGSSTSAFASASGLSRTMAMSISPPSFWIRAGRPACICARIATALFSHRVRSHSSRAGSLRQGASLCYCT